MKEARMFRTHVPAVVRRLGLLALVLLIAVLSTSMTHTQAAPAPAAGAQAAANPYMFTSDGVVLSYYVKPDKTADFDMIIGRLKEALAKSEKPERKEMAKNWKIFKATEAGPGMGTVYVSLIVPPVKGADYTVSTILSEAFPAEANDLYKKYAEAFATPPGSLLHLTLFSDLSQ
jgi:hypothetical protein